LKRAKKLLPYIDKGEANRYMARAKNRKKRRAKLRQKNNSANQIRKALGTCQDPIFSFFPDLVHDDRRQRGFVVENAVVPLLPYLPSDENNRRSQPFGRRGSGRCDGLPIINDLGSTFSKAAHKIRTREPGGCRGSDALGETAFKEDVPSRLGGASAELAGGGMRPSPFCQAVGGPKAILDGEPSKKAALRRGPSLPDNFPKLARKSCEELGFISGAGRVAPIRGQRPGDGILRVWNKLDFGKKIP
jgi:hypothetical protein